jgi:hypothetical protein
MRYFHFKVEKKDQDQKTAEKLIQAILELHEGDYLIEVKKKRAIRSLDANKYYHALIKVVSIETGHFVDEIENMFKMARHFEIVYYPSGKTEKIPKKTSNLDTKEFAAMCNNFIQWVQEEFPSVKFKRKEDTTYEDWMKINNDYEQAFSGF